MKVHFTSKNHSWKADLPAAPEKGDEVLVTVNGEIRNFFVVGRQWVMSETLKSHSLVVRVEHPSEIKTAKSRRAKK